MFYRVEVKNKESVGDSFSESVRHDLNEVLGKKAVEHVDVLYVTLIEGDLNAAAAERIAKELLADPVLQEYRINGDYPAEKGRIGFEVHKRPGVMDPAESSTLRGIRDLGLKADAVRTGTRYLLKSKAPQEELLAAARKVLANVVIEELREDKKDSLKTTLAPYVFRRVEVGLLGADEEELMHLSKAGSLFLTLAEMKGIQEHFRKEGRNPTDVELEMIAQTWSEHCVHKTLKSKVTFQGEVIDNLIKETVFRATKELNKPWCISVFKDNSGVIEFDDQWGVCFKVETHNHPSAIEPYGGAGTGIGGCIRDPMGTGLGAKPILNTDIFCFGNPDLPYDQVPKGALHPKRVMKGVVGGVRDYGNRMGIPTVNGAICFDERYIGNPLVFCGNVGLIPKDKCFGKVKAGDKILVVGGGTGRDGIHGATFSSGELTSESETVHGGAVQIGNAITQKKVLDVMLAARDENLYNAVTDCGAGGLSSAVGEMGSETGADVQIEKIPLKYEGLKYWEIWVSEAQERMVFSVPEKNVARFLELFAAEDVEASVIGTYSGDGRLRLSYQGNPVANLAMDFLHDGLPRWELKGEWAPPVAKRPEVKEQERYDAALLKILSMPNVASKEWVIRQYDHEVQGGSVIKPLVGVTNDGPGDASVTAPVAGSKRGVVLSCGINPKYGDIDPYRMAANAIDEAIRNAIAVGGDIERIAILDNFCWGNCTKPDRMGGLVLAAKACYDLSKAYGTPFISGKDSLNNEFKADGKQIAIPPTLLISAIGVVKDVTKCLTMDFKKAGNLIYQIGVTREEFGGSHYNEVLGVSGGEVPLVVPEKALAIFRALSSAVSAGLIRSMHDLSEGGLAVALAEMAFAGGLGAEVSLKSLEKQGIARNDTLLFAESASRFLVEIAPEKEKAFLDALNGLPVMKIGQVTKGTTLMVQGLKGQTLIDTEIAALKKAWQSPFNW